MISPSIGFDPLKQSAQQAQLARHHIKQELVKERTAHLMVWQKGVAALESLGCRSRLPLRKLPVHVSVEQEEGRLVAGNTACRPARLSLPL